MTPNEKRVLIVGINPSGSDPTRVSQSIKRLCKWTEEMGLTFFSFVNCISRPGPYRESDVDYDLLKECTKGYTKVIALGNFPSMALSKIDVEHFMLPHPSGLNRKLNDKSYEIKILEECRGYIEA
jgi:hypothetical protein